MTAIRVDGLSKRYRVVHGDQRPRYRTIRESLVETVAAPFRRTARDTTAEDFWALNDVSFEVQPGEVVGIIGRNGAGKSTLLKILSRITRPTKGRVEINGRVGSLLEVGTGFHPELTGRENICLNGSILGMCKTEIDRKFDAIVAFAEVERFLDTPVKRYSSGMYVRLAFAVAAHLEPEILIVDEVLSVGDAGFQRKCFDSMTRMRNNGTTILVVSHNLGAILSLCNRGINLECGHLLNDGKVDDQVAWYLARLSQQSQHSLLERTDREGDQTIRVSNIQLQDASGEGIEQVISGESVTIRVVCQAKTEAERADRVAISCWSGDGIKLFHIDTAIKGYNIDQAAMQRVYNCSIPRLPLPPGHYFLNVSVSADGKLKDHVYSACRFDVIAGDYFGTGRPVPANGCLMYVDHAWH